MADYGPDAQSTLLPDILLRLREHDDAKHATPVGEDVEEAVAHVLGEEAEPVLALGQRVDDVGYEGGKEEPQVLQHSVVLGLKAISKHIMANDGILLIKFFFLRQPEIFFW